jgi:uncharacterized protein YcbX
MTASISQLWFYPIKGCRGFPLAAATLAATGLEVDGVGDREWIVVDVSGKFLSQRELPAMALIETRLADGALRLSAPGMLKLEVPLASEGDVLKVRVWNDEVDAVTQGEVADAWFSSFLGQPCRLMRFDPEARRWSNSRYTGATAAPYKFADAFALLVCSEASLADLNARLGKRGAGSVGIERFRPNIVLGDIEAHEEDYADEIAVAGTRLRAVKPCVRCTVPNVDPATGVAGFEPGDTLAVYRNDQKAGGVTFGVNAIVESGAGNLIRVGDKVELNFNFR